MEPEELKAPVNTGHGIARMLRDSGVKYVFGIPDGHTLAFYDGILATDGIDHILVNDERSAAFAADAYARVTGEIGVCDAGAAGSMNFPVGLVEAKGASSPVLALVATVPRDDVFRNIPHDIKVAETLESVTKWVQKVLVAEHTPRFLNYALKLAVSSHAGPVALVIPEDIMRADERPLQEFIPRVAGACSINECRSVPAEGEILEAVRMIRAARQPVIFAGGGAIQSGAYAEVKKLSQILKIPVFTTIRGKGIMLPREIDTDPENYHFGTVGLFGEAPNNRFIRGKTDLVIVVGNRLTEDDTANFKYPDTTKEMVQIDVEPAEIGLFYRPWGVIGDPKAALTRIIEILEDKGPIETENGILEARKDNLQKLVKQHARYRKKDNVSWMDADPIKPQRILKAISDVITGDDYLVTDASASSRWIGAYFPVKSLGRKIITPRGVGPTGFGVGALIGTCIAVNGLSQTPDGNRIVLFTGDGGLMNGGFSEFETIQKLGLNCTIVVINNAALGFVKFGQAILHRRRFIATDRPDTNFARIAEAFGGTGVRVEKLSELDQAIRDAITSPGFQLVDVVVDPAELLPPNYY